MAGLPRSDLSFRRSGSSGLVWDDKLLSGELKPKVEEEKDKKDPQRSEPKPYRTMEVAATLDPPSPKVSGCGAICSMFGKPVKNQNQKQRRNR
ncbi:MAPK kinase substrate protein At1g80180-like [Rutidosis leptorrhynchoides]|uniref:MAPK kinase substrate protein At1g80180-like n=1 Tax=Rutidosis leptorrhynchoides TaxID=125765 RepID=UPI003A995A30